MKFAHGLLLALALGVVVLGSSCDDAARTQGMGDTCKTDGECKVGLFCDQTTGTCQSLDGIRGVDTVGGTDVVEADTSDNEVDEDADTAEPEDVQPGECEAGEVQNCGESNVGACTIFEQTCVDGQWTECEAVLPSEEICDGLDNDCDNSVDEQIQRECGLDVGVCLTGVQTCLGNGLEGDDAWGSCKGSIEPTDEICDRLDNDCDGDTDEDDAVDVKTYYLDSDGDDFGDPNESVTRCYAPEGYVENNLDCDDQRSDVNPNGVEACDGVDNDCDPATDDGADVVWLGDACDGDDSDLCEEGTLSCTDGARTCSDETTDDVEVCDGVDNDCDPNTDDGSAESWLNATCDGDDSDICEEGTYSCTAGVQVCSDETSDDIEVCDGVDNDCDPSTADGAAEAWLATSCDGDDTDLCEEGTYSCTDGAQACSDLTGNDDDVCDGVDNDCNPSTADGSAEIWLGDACDGADSDLCEEGVFECDGSGAKACTDTSSDDLELCDGVDNDCDANTDDGADEVWLNVACDGDDSDKCEEGTFKCVSGPLGASQTCTDNTGDDIEVCDGADNDCDPSTVDGAAESWMGDACDGPDSDLCQEGTYSCVSGGQSCSDTTSDDLEVCDGSDNDCNTATADGADETWLGNACDGPDSDQCNEGSFTCSGGAQACSDVSGDNLEFCDGNDNDCDPSTLDGSSETWYGIACDGADSDLCKEGTSVCSSGARSCTDNTGDDVEVCDGADNDCNPVTADGSAESWLGTACDGPDADFCAEGSFVCSGGAQSCSDSSGDNIEFCDGNDNDCNPGTPDGSGETWYAVACDGADSDLCNEGVFACSGSAQVCTDTTTDTLDLCDGNDNDCNPATADGSDEAWIGTTCDGADSDLCKEGVFECNTGTQACTDNTGDIVEICDAADNDCDGDTDEGCNCVNGSTQSCYSGPAGTAGVGICKSGTQTCSGGNWGACVGEVTPQAEVCDNVDNDCDVSTPDGSAEGWYNAACDGPDSDKCTEGVFSCSSGSQVCSDTTGNNIEVCDGADNDCDPLTADGAGEAWLGATCDGADSDLCAEGNYICNSGSQFCTDGTGDDLDVCDGADNDCNSATADGSDEAWMGAACDGPDSDLCTEGTYSCSSGSQSCSDATGDTLDVCDGNDNDCNPATDDGEDEAWLGTACDGPDSDLCTEGTYSCSSGAQSCSDATGDTLDVCDGTDNDCDSSTPDGADEGWYGDACDGPDSDLCQEGNFVCTSGAQACDDATSDTLDVCDGADNDCNPATDDGEGESWYNDPCDGTDSDLCDEGIYGCTAGAQTCSDNSGSNLDVCDGNDNDCNPATNDGSGEGWYNDPCDGTDSDLCAEGIFGCTAGSQTCSDTTGDTLDVCNGVNDDCNTATADGADETWLGDPCDGVDTDLCVEGSFVCSGGAQTCNDTTGSTVDVCDGVDNDCNPATDDGEGEGWYNNPCDGTDSDLCNEGVFGCSGGAQSCSDNTGDTLDVCDGNDNDCNSGTADGSDEGWYGDPCDGADGDLCNEGSFTCSGGAQSCTDTTGTSFDLCDGGVDNDCNPATAEGSGEGWYGDPCDGPDTDLCNEGTFACPTGSQTCTDTSGDDAEVCDGTDNDCDPSTVDGSDETWIGNPCDGGDSDLCQEGVFSCSVGSQNCSDFTGDNEEVCDGDDNDCDGQVDEEDVCACDGVDADFDGYTDCDECNDNDGSINPGAAEVCNGIDDDCDGDVDEDFDMDGDGYATCTSDPFLYDCDDNPSTGACVNPGIIGDCGVGAAPSCAFDTASPDGIDNNCNGYVDENCTPCDDTDNDGDGFSECDGDCNDGNTSVFPGAAEECDNIDNDCNMFTRANCNVSQACDLDGDGNEDTGPDTCGEDFFCAPCSPGTCSGSLCVSFCQGSFTDPPPNGGGCTSTQDCATYILTGTANEAVCNETANTLGTKLGGAVCSSGSECRSGVCEKPCQGGPGCNTQPTQCVDHCDHHDPGANGSCASGSRCFPSGGHARCIVDSYINTGTALTGDSCTSNTYNCLWGPDTCINGVCGAPCRLEEHCPSGYHCDMFHNENVSNEVVPVCLANTSGNKGRPAGAACSANVDCDSEFCESTRGICLEMCTGDGHCPAGFQCEESYVRIGGGTSTTLTHLCLTSPDSTNTSSTPYEPM